MVGGNLADNALSDNPIIGILFGNSPCYGAWFLWSLFFMSVIVLSLRRMNVLGLIILFFVMSYIPLNLEANFKGITSLYSATMWLLMGCVVRKHYGHVSKFLNIYVLLVSFVTILLIHNLACHFLEFSQVVFARSMAIIKTLTGIVASYSLCYILASRYKTSVVSKTLQMCGDYCMDIYIISMFVLVPLRILYVNVGLMYYIPYYLWLVIASFLGCVIPILVSKYFVRKTRILKLVLLGR